MFEFEESCLPLELTDLSYGSDQPLLASSLGLDPAVKNQREVDLVGGCTETNILAHTIRVSACFAWSFRCRCTWRTFLVCPLRESGNSSRNFQQLIFGSNARRSPNLTAYVFSF